MGSIGVGEILVLMLVGLLVFGPDRLPEIMRNVGKAIRAFRDESQRAAAMLKEGLEDPPPARPTASPVAGVIDLPDAQPVATPDLVADHPADAEARPAEASAASEGAAPERRRADVPESVRKYEDT